MRAPLFWIGAAAAISIAGCGRNAGTAKPRLDANVEDSAAVAVARPAEVPPPAEEAARCEDARDVHLFVSPRAPSGSAPLRIIAVTDRPMRAELRVERVDRGKHADAGGVPVLTVPAASRKGETPYFWIAQIDSPRAGGYVAQLVQTACNPGEGTTSRTVNVASSAPPAAPPPSLDEGLWPAGSVWSHHLEQVYSAWVEALFDAPDDEMPSWGALHEVIRDPKRNFLFDHLGMGEDDVNAPVLRPDCADLPYFLRAYFAFKLGLPFAIGHCIPGGGGTPPSCDESMVTNDDVPLSRDAGASEASRFESFLHVTVADRAHSSSARQPFEEENSDYYPVPLTWESLRPGTVYADPYGHVLVVAKRLPQTPARGGALYAIDAQPDGTVARKRFWRGNFLYATDRELGGPGFKRFRPIGLGKVDGGTEDVLLRPTDDAILANREYGDLSREASALDVDGFYDRMDAILSPRPLDPERAMLETIGALEEQVRTRVKSVDNGRRWLETATTPAPMPDGGEIFETAGPWEDFSTPSRDLRILIAIDVVRGFPARVAKRPERYTMPSGKSPAEVSADLEKLLERELKERTITYTRTDGSPFVLSLTDVSAREAALEVAYDPNDCVELRWGAPEGSAEAATCKARAPEEQRARMEGYRAWFRGRKRPARK